MIDTKSIALYILITFCKTSLLGQVLNIDREIEIDSLHDKIETYVNLSFNTDKLKKELIDLSVKIESDLFIKNNYVLVALYSNLNPTRTPY